jgi:hypothetical protein
VCLPGTVAGVVGPLDPNTYSAEHPGRHAAGRSAGQVLELRRPVDRLEGHWLKALAAVDACGRHPGPLPTAGWLRNRLRVVVELDSLLGHGGLGGEAAGRDPWVRRWLAAGL